MSHLVDLPSLWQEYHTFPVEPNILFQRNTSESNTTISKTTDNINAEIPALM